MKLNGVNLKIVKKGEEVLAGDYVIGNKKGNANEHSTRKACCDALRKANRLKKEKLVLYFLNTSESFPLRAVAKITAQELLRHIKYSNPSTSLKEIILVLENKKAYQAFKKEVFGYLSYIQYKLSQGPFVTVDTIIDVKGKIVLIKRSNPPFGWAIPGGFLDYGEFLEECAKRESKEETGLDVYNLKQMHTYSDPKRDPRFQTVTTVFTAKAKGVPCAGDDACEVTLVTIDEALCLNLAFDHNEVLRDYKNLVNNR